MVNRAQAAMDDVSADKKLGSRHASRVKVWESRQAQTAANLRAHKEKLQKKADNDAALTETAIDDAANAAMDDRKAANERRALAERRHGEEYQHAQTDRDYNQDNKSRMRSFLSSQRERQASQMQAKADSDRADRENRVRRNLEMRSIDGSFLLQSRVARVKMSHTGNQRYSWARPETPNYMGGTRMHAINPALPPAILHKSYSSFPPSAE